MITGALTGIGRATAIAFAREVAHLIVSGRHEEEGEKLSPEVRKLKRRLMLASLRYLDTYVKTDGTSLFAERLLYVDWLEERALS